MMQSNSCVYIIQINAYGKAGFCVFSKLQGDKNWMSQKNFVYCTTESTHFQCIICKELLGHIVFHCKYRVTLIRATFVAKCSNQIINV